MNRFVRIDRRYSNPYRLTPYAQRALLKWGALLVVWVLLISSNGWLAVLATIALIWYAVHRYRVNHPRAVAAESGYGRVAPAYAPPALQRFNPAPGWPVITRTCPGGSMAGTPDRVDAGP